MRPKNKQKLVLKKQTVSHLDQYQMVRVKAGARWTDPVVCETIYTCFKYTQNMCPTTESDGPGYTEYYTDTCNCPTHTVTDPRISCTALPCPG